MDERQIFEAALDLTDPDARAAHLDEACRGDSDLRERVEALLRSHEAADSFLQTPVEAVSPTIEQGPVAKTGDRIGPYKLLQKLGEGGMGEVYMAEQIESVERRVALKIIKAGMDTRQVIARFEAERQALAIMDHPNIAKVFDAGTTETGRPYFVMELVKGVPITQYCDEHRLDPRERLHLFKDVCHAIQHAHQKGIIHRDIKPTNVMVAEYDDVAVPKIIDFGVAKATQQRLTQKTMFTEVGSVIGTIEYMSPEQAKLNQLDIDTRSDIYSLGVLLYELLTGETPFDRKKLRGAAFDEMLRIIREEEPSRPSLKLSTSESLPSVATNRKIDPARLSTLVRGELDWIVMKALEKDRSRRYDTANAFADDIRNYLSDEAVQACPPSAAYRFRKFARNLAALTIAAIVLPTSLIGGSTSVALIAQQRDAAKVAAQDADHQRDEARRQTGLARIKAEEAEKQRRRAEANLTKGREAVDKFFTQVAEDLGGQPHLEQVRRELLEDALEFYEGFLDQKSNDPVVRHETSLAALRVARIQNLLGNFIKSAQATNRAVEILRTLTTEFPSNNVYRSDLSATERLQAGAKLWTDDSQDGIAAAIEALTEAEQLSKQFPTVPGYRRSVAKAHARLGISLMEHFRRNDAERHLRQSLEEWKQLYEEFPQFKKDEPGICHSRQWLGVHLFRHNNLQEAETLLQTVYDFRQKSLAGDPDSPTLRSGMAHITCYMGELYREMGRAGEAEDRFRKALRIREELLNEHPDVFEHQRRLAHIHAQLGALYMYGRRSREAAEAFARTLAIHNEISADASNENRRRQWSAWNQYMLGLVSYQTGDTQQAVDAFQQASTLFETNLEQNPNHRIYQQHLGWFLAFCPATQFRDPQRAVQLSKRALQVAPESRLAWQALGAALLQLGDIDGAAAAIEVSMEHFNGGTGQHWMLLALAQWQLDRKEAARESYTKAVEWMDKHQPHDVELDRFRKDADALIGTVGVHSGKSGPAEGEPTEDATLKEATAPNIP